MREGETSSGETSPANDTSEEKGTGIVLSVKVYHIHGRVRDRVRTESWILEKVFKFSQLYSRPGKVWKMELKSWKYGRKPWVFFESYNKCFTKEILSCRSNLIQSRLHVMEKALPLFFFKFSVSLLITYQPGKRNYIFGKSLEIVLNFKSKICTNPEERQGKS